MFLSQAFYWTSRTKDPDGWFYKSQVEWEEETALTRYEQENVRRGLKTRGLIEEKKEGIPCRLFFRINKDSLLEAMGGYFKPLSLEEILLLCKSSLSQLSQMGLMRAKKLGIEYEYVDYAEVLKVHGSSCHICSQPITQGVGQSGGALSFDHVIPVSKGGSHTANNVKPSHANCNIVKSDNTPNPCCDQDVVAQQTSLLCHNGQVPSPATNILYTETTPEITHTRGDLEEKPFGFGFGFGSSTDILVASSNNHEQKSEELLLSEWGQGSGAAENISKNSLRVSNAYIRELEMSFKGKLPAYRFKRGAKGIYPEFAEYIRQRLITYRKSDVPVDEAIKFITKREPGGCLQVEWEDVLGKCDEWQKSISIVQEPTKGQLLATEVAIALNKAQIEVTNRFEKVGNCYQWEIAPGVPIPDIVDWYANQISKSKRPELAGKTASVIAALDFQNLSIAAIVYGDYEKYAQTIIGNCDRITESKSAFIPKPPSETTVSVTPEPNTEDELSSRIARLQGYLNGGIPFFINRALAEIESGTELVIVNGIVEEAV